MKIKLFEEYEMEYDGDIGEEYAKMVISKYIDNDLDNKTLEDTFYDLLKDDDAVLNDGDEHDEAIIYSIIRYLEETLTQARKLKKIKQIGLNREAKKFNL
jgi:hypothetical protein